MTTDKRDLIAETIWRAEYRRATEKERSIPWSEVLSEHQDKYRYLADAILAALVAEQSDDDDGQPDERQEWRDFDPEA